MGFVDGIDVTCCVHMDISLLNYQNECFSRIIVILHCIFHLY